MLPPVETRSVSPVFVGRAGELATLNEALDGAASAEPQALLLGGEAGVGKTRLVEEFADAARRQGAVVALGGCVEIGADGLPFAPFSTALRALRRQLPGELADAAAGQEEELARLLPELGEGAPVTGGGRHDEESMARLFELTARLLERVAARHTVVLVLEDLHWADASTRHLIAYLVRTLRTGRLVVLATYRSDDIHRRHPLRPLLAELDRLRTVRRIELGRFTRDEVGRQIAGILAYEPDPLQVDEIFERSDGNAFFVEELAVAAHEGCCTGLTDSLRDLLLVRVEALPESAQRVARIVAEGGSTVEYRLLAAVASLAEDDLIEALRAAVGANILLPAPDGDGYRFRHSLVREAVADDLLPGERSRLNRRYAEALDADPTLVPAAERVMRLASYWYHAHDPARALPAVLDASVEARRRHAYSEQLRLLERAMELWDSVPDEVRATLRPVDYTEVYPPCGCDPATAPLRYLDLMAEAAVAGRLCGERERALKITKRALRLLEEEQEAGAGMPASGRDPQRAAWFWTQRSLLVQAQGRGDGWRELGIAQELVRGLPPSQVHAEVLAMAANWSMLHDPGPDAVVAAERAVEYARMVGAADIELNARLTLGGLMVDAGHIDAGLAEMFQVRDQVVAQGRSAVVARSHVNLPSVLESVGRSEEAIGILREGVEITRRMGLLESEAWVWGNLSESLISLGRWDEALEAAARPRPRGAVPPHAAAPPSSGPSSPSPGAGRPRPPGCSPRPAPPTARTTPCRSTASRWPPSPSASPPPRAASRTPAPNSAGCWTRACRPAPSATAGRCCCPPPRRRPTHAGCLPPRRDGPRPWNGSRAPPSRSPPAHRSGSPTRSGSAPNSTGPRAGTPRRSGRRRSPPSSAWSGPTNSPGSGTGSPPPSWTPAVRTSAPAPRNCSAWPVPSPGTSAPVRWPTPSTCSAGAPASPWVAPPGPSASPPTRPRPWASPAGNAMCCAWSPTAAPTAR